MEHEIVIIDSVSFSCTKCEETIALSQAIVTDTFDYIFFARCESCGADNFYNLKKILGSLRITIVAKGSERIN